MAARQRLDPQLKSAPFERFRTIQRLGAERSGHASAEHARHQLYVGRDTSPHQHMPNDTAASIAPYLDYLVIASKMTISVVTGEVSP